MSHYLNNELTCSTKRCSARKPVLVARRPQFEVEHIDSLMSRQGDEIMRTYKVGLRVPESLLEEQYRLVTELEVVSHLRKQFKGKLVKPKNFKKKSASEAYKTALDNYKSLGTIEQAKLEIRRLRTSINKLHWKNPILNSSNFTHSQIPSFSNPEAPSLQEISLTDYQNIANKSLKMVCKHLNDQILHEVHKIPKVKQDFINLAFQISQQEGKNYTLNQIQNRFEIALACITGIHSNIGRTAFYQLGMAMKAYFDLREKVEFVQQRLDPSLSSSADFSGEIPILLAFYSIPNNLRKYITHAWGVDAQWVRNTLVGWRRKIDALLPVEFQIEPLTNTFIQIAEFLKRFARNEDDLKVIGRLQKKHVLHLLPNEGIDLNPLLPQHLRSNYHSFRGKLTRVPNAVKAPLHSITSKEFLDSANELIGRVQTNQARFPATSQPYTNCQTFINKINYIIKRVKNPEFKEILKHYIIGNRFTRGIANLLEKGSKYTRLFTALRGIIALTLAKKHASAIGQLLSVFTPDNCLTFPFTSSNREASHLPVNLLFNKYVVERKAHPASAEFLVNKSGAKPNVTDFFRNGRPIWLGIPIYAPSQEQEFSELLSKKRNTVVRKGIFWFQLIPSKKIVECIRRGANVIDLRLNIPSGPTNKIVADVVLSSQEANVFQHQGRFLTAWDSELATFQLPQHEILGVDFNRIGKYLVATANPNIEHDLSEIMELYQKTHIKLEKFRKWEIPHVQRQLSTGKDKAGKVLTPKRRGRLETQITLLHRRKQKLQKEMKRHALMVYLYVAWKTKASYLAWDSIGGISTRGQRGALAQAITYLPKRKALVDEFKQWAQDLSDQGLLSLYRDTIPVSPFNSQVCAHCFQRTGLQQKTKVKNIPYDEFQCKSCGRSTQQTPIINRHSNSARVSALLLQQLVSPGQPPSRRSLFARLPRTCGDPFSCPRNKHPGFDM